MRSSAGGYFSGQPPFVQGMPNRAMGPQTQAAMMPCFGSNMPGHSQQQWGQPGASMQVQAQPYTQPHPPPQVRPLLGQAPALAGVPPHSNFFAHSRVQEQGELHLRQYQHGQNPRQQQQLRPPPPFPLGPQPPLHPPHPSTSSSCLLRPVHGSAPAPVSTANSLFCNAAPAPQPRTQHLSPPPPAPPPPLSCLVQAGALGAAASPLRLPPELEWLQREVRAQGSGEEGGDQRLHASQIRSGLIKVMSSVRRMRELADPTNGSGASSEQAPSLDGKCHPAKDELQSLGEEVRSLLAPMVGTSAGGELQWEGRTPEWKTAVRRRKQVQSYRARRRRARRQAWEARRAAEAEAEAQTRARREADQRAEHMRLREEQALRARTRSSKCRGEAATLLLMAERLLLLRQLRGSKAPGSHRDAARKPPCARSTPVPGSNNAPVTNSPGDFEEVCDASTEDERRELDGLWDQLQGHPCTDAGGSACADVAGEQEPDVDTSDCGVSMEQLVEIRWGWDAFIAADSCEEATCIPDGWVWPMPPRDDTWASRLVPDLNGHHE